MNIGIDMRALQKGGWSGVENYTLHTAELLAKNNPEHTFYYFFNAFGKITQEPPQFVNTKVIRKHIPSKLLILTIKLFGWPKLDKLFGVKLDWLFMPNLNHVAVSREVKLALTVHDLSFVEEPNFFNLKSRIWHRSLGLHNLFTRADRIFAVSNFTKAVLIRRYNLPEGKIIVTTEGVDHKTYHPELSHRQLRAVRNKYFLPGKFILFLGTLERRKNLMGILKAFELVADSDLWLVLAGRPGRGFKDFLQAVNNSPKNRFVRILGFVKEAEKPYLYKLASLFAFPSLYEGFGLPALEALSVGTPVVTSRLTSLPEVVGRAGVLVDPRNINDLSLAFTAVLTDPVLQQKLSTQGLERSVLFSWEDSVKKTMEGFNI